MHLDYLSAFSVQNVAADLTLLIALRSGNIHREREVQVQVGDKTASTLTLSHAQYVTTGDGPLV